MGDRRDQIVAFLTRIGWEKAQRAPLADDASFRRYERLIRVEGNENHKAVLMDAPPTFEDVRPFVAVALYLKGRGLAAPELIARDYETGLLLLEDFGDQIFARVMAAAPAQENSLYRLAIDGLIALHKVTPPQNLEVPEDQDYRLSHYDMAIMLPEVSLFTDWYLPALTGKALSDEERAEFQHVWRQALMPLAAKLDGLVLRDYHAENLMLRQGGQGLAKLGLLDFQDAVIGHKAYDLASLLQDARRDVPPELEMEMLDYYLTKTGAGEEDFRRDYALLAAQRNCKIIGIFARLYMRDGKANYLKLIPRVWGLLNRDLAHPALADVRAWMDKYITAAQRTDPLTPCPSYPQKAMILAAGLGLRMRPLTDHCPKPLIPVAGKEMLGYALEKLVASGIKDVVINMHHLAHQIEKFADHYYDHRLNISLSDERDRLEDSGGGVKKALPQLGEKPFFVLNSDMIWRDGSRQMFHRMQAFWQDDSMDVLLLLVPRGRAFGYDGPGDYFMGQGGRLIHRGTADQADYVFGGISIIKPECFTDTPLAPFSLRIVFDKAAEQGRLCGVIHDGEWYHVGTEAALIQVEEILGKGD